MVPSLRRTTLGLLIGLALSGLWAGTAGAYDEVDVFGVLEAKDTVARTVTVNEVAYEVTSATRLKNMEGAATTLETLVPFDRHAAGLYTDDDATNVALKATQIDGRWILLELQLIRALPQ